VVPPGITRHDRQRCAVGGALRIKALRNLACRLLARGLRVAQLLLACADEPFGDHAAGGQPRPCVAVKPR
jgi:hypothetical protein